MKSMTGYGRGEALQYDRKFVVEIKSVNHRYNEVTVKLPRPMIMYEDAVKKVVGQKVFRGKTDVLVGFESFSDEDVSIEFNKPLADAYIRVLEQIKERYELDQPIRLDLVAKFPDVVTVNKAVSADSGDKIWACLETALKEAVAYGCRRVPAKAACKAERSGRAECGRGQIDNRGDHICRQSLYRRGNNTSLQPYRADEKYCCRECACRQKT